MKKSRVIYWGIVGALVCAGLGLSVVKRNGHYAFQWQASELMAQTKDGDYHALSALENFNRVLFQLQQNYVDPSRLQPNLMISSALDELQKSVPELLFIFDKPVREHPTRVEVRIQEQTRSFSLENIDNLWEMSLRLRRILTFVQDYLPQDAKPQSLEYDVINGMLSALDPHSVILSPEMYRSMMEGNRGKFGGLGIVVRMIDGVLIVVEPVAGDVPARRAGIEEGDQILTIDGTPTLNMNISEAVELLKGEPKTTVRLSVMRKGWEKPKDIDVIRDEIQIPSLESDSLGDKIAYIRLKSFQGNSQSDMTKALEKLRKDMGGINGLVFDLRGNPGGLLEQAVYIADNFLDSGNIVTTVGANDTLAQPRDATQGTTQDNYPIIVLMDYSSASASEIVAGALKNNNRAIVVGDTSFGKGSVQVLYELPDKSALKLTIGQYLTPGNQSIQSVGIVPDIRLVPMMASQGDIDLYPKPWVRREESLGGHLVNQNAVKNLKPAYNLRYLSQRYDLPEDELDEDSILTLEDVDKIIKAKTKNKKPKDDPQVRLARQILLRIGAVSNRRAMVEKFLQSADSLQNEEDRVLVDALGKRGIDWENGVRPENVRLALDLTTDKPDNLTVAGDEVVVTAAATNLGEQTLYRVVGLTESTFGRANDREFIFGRIDPGQTVRRELKLKTNRAQVSRVDKFETKVYLDEGTPYPQNSVADKTIELSTRAIAQPDFKIHYAILDRDGNSQAVGNGLLDDGETVTLRLWVSNDGDGVAEKPLIFLKNKAPEIRLVDARAETEPLEKGRRVMRDFTFRTTEVGKGDVQLELHVYDKASTRMLVEKIAFKTSRSDETEGFHVEPQSATLATGENARLYVSPAPSANTLVALPPGAVVSSDAVFGGFTHIVAGELRGWVQTTQLTPSHAAVTPIEPQTIATIPRIRLADMPHATTGDKIEIQADVSGFAPLIDYYVYASTEVDHVYDYQKVAYGELSGDAAQIRTTVPLRPGLNSIRLFVRDKNKSEAHETILVYRRQDG